MTSDGKVMFDTVYAFGDALPNTAAEFVVLTTHAQTLRLTRGHFVRTTSGESSPPAAMSNCIPVPCCTCLAAVCRAVYSGACSLTLLPCCTFSIASCPAGLAKRAGEVAIGDSIFVLQNDTFHAAQITGASLKLMALTESGGLHDWLAQPCCARG